MLRAEREGAIHSSGSSGDAWVLEKWSIVTHWAKKSRKKGFESFGFPYKAILWFWISELLQNRKEPLEFQIRIFVRMDRAHGPSYHNAVLRSGHHLVLWVSLQTRQHGRQEIGEQQVVILSISTVGKTERKLAFSVKSNTLQDLASWHNSELQIIFIYRTIAQIELVPIRRNLNWGRTWLLLLVITKSQMKLGP